MGFEKAGTLATYMYLLQELSHRGVAFVELVRMVPGFYEPGRATEVDVEKELRPYAKVPVIMNGGYTAQQAADAVETELAQAVSFGRPYLANPDLPTRFRHNFDLNEADYKTFYVYPEHEIEKGYTDYPFKGLKPAIEKLTK